MKQTVSRSVPRSTKLASVWMGMMLAAGGCALTTPDPQNPEPPNVDPPSESNGTSPADRYDGTFGSYVKELYDETPMYPGAPEDPDPNVGRLPLDLSAESSLAAHAVTAWGMAFFWAVFAGREGDKVCFTRSTDELDLNADAADAYRWREELDVRVEALDALTPRKSTALWPSQGARLQDFSVTSDEVKDKQKGGVIRRLRVVEYRFCARVAVTPATKYLAMAVHERAEPSGDHAPDGLVLWTIQADTSAPPARE